MRTTLNTYAKRHSLLTIETYDGEEFELELWQTPCDWLDMHTEQIGDKLVVAYLVHDDSPSNPMTDYDAMGELITYRCGVITDGDPWSHLGLLESPYRGDLTKDFEIDAVYDLAKEKVWFEVGCDVDFWDWVSGEYVPEDGEPWEAFIRAAFEDIDFGKYGTDIPLWLETIWERCQDQAWDELYEQGKIGTYLAVPVNYCDSNHGPGTASAYTCSIDNSNAVWIPTKCDLENIVQPGLTYQELYKRADKYAQSCLDEYIKWCNGEAYGCVVEVFQRNEDNSWEQIQEDSCWGFLGSEWAEEALKSEFFDPTIERIKRDQHQS